MMVFMLFFQAVVGIRDLTVTGVQTCALPIFHSARQLAILDAFGSLDPAREQFAELVGQRAAREAEKASRSEERRVGKECRSRWSPDHEKKINLSTVKNTGYIDHTAILGTINP